jgi:predicted ATP-dependent serine protease
MKEAPDALTCPECGADKPHKLVTPFQTNSWSSFLDTMEKKVNPHKFK